LRFEKAKIVCGGVFLGQKIGLAFETEISYISLKNGNTPQNYYW
jgi:hypothetical protein